MQWDEMKKQLEVLGIKDDDIVDFIQYENDTGEEKLHIARAGKHIDITVE